VLPRRTALVGLVRRGFPTVSGSCKRLGKRVSLSTRAAGQVQEDLSYSPAELFEVMQPPESSHEGFGHARPTGRTKPRSEVHKDGDWHHSVHVWLHDQQSDKVLIQRRSMYKDTNPGKLDVSAAGHITFGDSSHDTAVKELSEELGIVAPPDLVRKYFTAVSEEKGETEKFGSYICREFQDIYIVRKDELESKIGSKVEVKVADGEVDEALWVNTAHLRKSLEQRDPEYVSRTGSYVSALFEAMQSESSCQ